MELGALPTQINTYELAEGGLTALAIVGGLAVIPSNPGAGVLLFLIGIGFGAVQLFEHGIIKL